MSLKIYNVSLLSGNFLGVVVAILYGIMRDKGGVGFAYIILGFSVVAILSMLFLLLGFIYFKMRLSQGLNIIIPITILILNVLEFSFLGYLSIW